jgi:hypothetical protein
VELAAGDLRKAHERLGAPDEIVHQRRVLYSVAVDLATDAADPPVLDDDVLDNPAVRGHLGAVLSGRSVLGGRSGLSGRPGGSPDHLRPLADLVAPGFAAEVHGCPVRLASVPGASAALAGALQRIADELGRHGDENTALSLLTTEVGDVAGAFGRVLEGVWLAVRVAPELAFDLLPHVALFGVVVADGAARFGSASAREYPGLILIPVPGSALEVAEALVHEGAHQKFFDLGVTRAVLGAQSPQAPRFTPFWAPAGTPSWPLEQSVAAWHAYRCLAVFAHALDASGENVVRHPESLLPKAAERAAELGRWVRGMGSFLGPDAHLLIEALEGEAPADPWPAEEATPDVDRAADDDSCIVRPAGSRTLLARRGVPPSLYWVRSGAAADPGPGRSGTP